MDTLNAEEIGSRIKENRIKLDLTMEEFSYKAGISARYLSYIENGSKRMSMDTLYGVAKALGKSTDWVFSGNFSEKND